jgi:DNA adenine methylase
LIPLEADRYIEPFVGSGCVFFDRVPREALLSDFNGELVHFFQQLRDSPKRISSSLERLAPTGDDFYIVRSQIPSDMTSGERAARFLYLNRFAFNGVYRTNRSGAFNVPRGSRTGHLPSLGQLEMLSHALAGVSILQRDYLEATSEADSGDYVYLDPPYRNATRPTYGEYGYGAFGMDEDVQKLALELRRLNKIGARVILSFNDDAEILSALEGWTVRRIERRRSVAGSAKHRTALTGEILAYNFTAVAHA